MSLRSAGGVGGIGRREVRVSKSGLPYGTDGFLTISLQVKMEMGSESRWVLVMRYLSPLDEEASIKPC